MHKPIAIGVKFEKYINMGKGRLWEAYKIRHKGKTYNALYQDDYDCQAVSFSSKDGREVIDDETLQELLSLFKDDGEVFTRDNGKISKTVVFYSEGICRSSQ